VAPANAGASATDATTAADASPASAPSRTVPPSSNDAAASAEGDTVRGRGKPCVVTTVERKSGFVRVGVLPSATVAHTNERIVELLRREPHPVRTITTDNGTEFHGYRDFERELGTTVYFATPHHAWERGTSENTNGLIRQYLPKGTRLGHLTQADCARIAAKLNARPRKCLGFRTPQEVYYRSARRTRR
jgi:transposase, IS30 family